MEEVACIYILTEINFALKFFSTVAWNGTSSQKNREIEVTMSSPFPCRLATVTGRFTKSKLNKYNWTKQLNKKSVEQKSIEQKVNWASGDLNKYLIDQIPTGQMHLNKITVTIEQMLNWANGHSRGVHRLRLAECVVARSATKPGGFGGLAPHSRKRLKPSTTFRLIQATTDPNHTF